MKQEFLRILRQHLQRYPKIEPQDVGKLCFQSEFGPEHMIASPERVEQYILTEWKEAAPMGKVCPRGEDIGNGLVRFHLTGEYDPQIAAPLLTKLFCLTAKNHAGTRQGLEQRLELAGMLKLPNWEAWLRDYREKGCPPVHHSDGFRQAYQPHYRLLDKACAGYFPALMEIATLKKGIVAIDGRCGSGKTGFGALTAQVFDCNVIHMDDFYLPVSRRQENWKSIPGGNMDFDRLIHQVLEPLHRGETVKVRPYDCQSGSYGPEQVYDPSALTILEGSYSHHPALRQYYDKMIFLTCPKSVQISRLMEREGDYFAMFEKLWIPLEESYLAACPLSPEAFVVDTGDLFG